MRDIFPDQRADPLTSPAPADATGIYLDIHSYSQLVLWPWGFTHTVAPNGLALQTLGRKFAYFNNYEPDQAIGLYPTDGTTDDFGYGELGVASYTFELGTAFFQSCSSFESTILPDNLEALLYAAKVVRTPYMTPAGPDALNVVAAPATITVGDPVVLTATINDTRYNNSNGAEPSQAIAAAEYYIDTPPWQPGAVAYAMVAADNSFDSTVETVTATVDASGLSAGRHLLFVRGRDAAGNWGAFSAVFLNVRAPCAFDVNGDGDNDILDVQLVAGAFGLDVPEYDFNGNGVVDVLDIQAVADRWHVGCWNDGVFAP
jgi:carboxypeptidase T